MKKILLRNFYPTNLFLIFSIQLEKALSEHKTAQNVDAKFNKTSS